MDVLLLVAMLAVGASALFVAATFDRRVTRRIEQLVTKALRDASAASLSVGNELESRLAGQLDGLGGDFGRRLGDVAARERVERDKRLDLLARMDAKTEAIKQRVEMALASQQASQQADEKHDRWAAEQMAAMGRQVDATLSGQDEILDFLSAALDDEARAAGADRRRVVTTALQVGVAADVIEGLAGAFCAAAGFTVMLPAKAGPTARGPYLAWRPADGRSLEEFLAAVLAACPDEQAPPVAGLDELRRLALVLHAAGPGTIRVGPMILNRTPSALIGCVIANRDRAAPGPADLPAAAAVPSPPGLASPSAAAVLRASAQEYGDRLGGLREGQVVDLTSWAAGYSR